MPDNAERRGPYKVGRLAVVNEQIRHLGQRAILLDVRQEIEDALHAVATQLETAALTWGDPQYSTKHPGGLVLRVPTSCGMLPSNTSVLSSFSISVFFRAIRLAASRSQELRLRGSVGEQGDLRAGRSGRVRRLAPSAVEQEGASLLTALA